MAAPSTIRVGRLLYKNSHFIHRQPNYALCKQLSSLSVVCERYYSSAPIGQAGAEKAEKISQAVKAYITKAKAHEDFMAGETHEYEIGKRHLAHMMGADPDNFTQEDIDRAVEYLLPSGLSDKKARPMLKPPDEVIPRRKGTQFGYDGRPFHSLFYTAHPNFYQLMHNISLRLDRLTEIEDKNDALGLAPDVQRQIVLTGGEWIQKSQLESRLTETLRDVHYDSFVKLFERLARHPYSYEEESLINEFRNSLVDTTIIRDIPELLYDEDGRGYQEAKGNRKSAEAKVKVWLQGSGKIDVNGRDLLRYFPSILDREQILLPLQFTGLLGEVDFEAVVGGGGHSSQAGAIRLALSKALQSMVNRKMLENMRIAGLLTRDPRIRERKKPGQEGARRKFTWKKR